LNDERLVTRLIALINPQHPAEKHTNAAQSLCDIIRLSREQMTSTIQDTMSTGSDALLKSIETPETVSSLLDHMLNGEHVESVIINGLYVIQTLLECRKVSPDGLQEPLSVMDLQQLSPGAASTISAIVVRLKDFHQLLLNPPKQHYMPMPTSVGIMQVPLGQTRLQIVRLISMLIMTNLESVNGELASLGTLSVLLDLFFQYSWNNFLHAYVEQCVSAVLSYSQNNSVLQTQLLSEFHLLERIAEAFEANQALQSQPGQQRRGYMGHLTRIANQLAGSTVVVDTPRDGERRHINSLFEGLPDPVREQWNDCVCGHLADINKLNTVELVGGSSGLTSSSDDDDDFRSISFPQDDALQKAFSEYQQQKMTSDFVEQFGFNEEEFAEHEECIGSPFNERVSSISFELSTVEDSPSAAAMFEHACSDRIRQFDSTDSDEELWEDKELSFSRSSDNRHSSVNQQRSTGANPGVATMTAADHRTAAAAAGAMRNVDSDEDDVDDDYDDEQDEVLNSGENSGDDSDPELTSPRIIRQQPADEASGMPEGDQSSSPKEDGSDVSLKIGGATGEQSTDNDVQQQQTETIDVGSPNDSQVSALCLDKLSDISDKVQDSVELSEDIVEVDQVSIDVLSGSSIDHDNIQTPVDLLTRNNDVNKLESVRMPCLVDACGGSDSVSYSAIANGPI
jgi:serine/threonine-protein phosphatase 6 regulatory subunit 3